MLTRRLHIYLAVLMLIVCTTCVGAATTAFTYQGKLADSLGQPANGAYTMRFRLWDAPTGGAQVGSAVTKTGVSLSGGLFTVELDFGAAAFNTGAPTSFAPSGAAGGDLAGVYPNPTIADGAITSSDLAVDPGSLARVSGGTMSSGPTGISVGAGPVNGPLRVYSPTFTRDQWAGVMYEETSVSIDTRWQSFTAGVSGSLAAIAMTLGAADGSDWSGVLRIYQGTGTGGAVLYSQPIANQGFSNCVYALDAPVPITAQNIYTFAVEPAVPIKWKTSYQSLGDSYDRRRHGRRVRQLCPSHQRYEGAGELRHIPVRLRQHRHRDHEPRGCPDRERCAESRPERSEREHPRAGSNSLRRPRHG